MKKLLCKYFLIWKIIYSMYEECCQSWILIANESWVALFLNSVYEDTYWKQTILNVLNDNVSKNTKKIDQK